MPNSTRRRTKPDEAEVETTSQAPDTRSPEDKAAAERTAKILAKARKQARTAFTAWQFFREQARLDAKFHAGTWGEQTMQWPPEIADARKAQQRACLTINRAPGFVRLVTNQARKANLRIIVKPVDDEGDVKLAEVIQGLIRNVETQSFADRAYSKGSEKQAEQGLGFFRLLTEWADDKSFRTRIRIKREPNPLAILIDPASQEPDFSDAHYAFKFTAIDSETYEDLYGHAAPAPSSLEGLDDGMAVTGDWFPNGKIGIAEYFNRELRGKRKIAQLKSGLVVVCPDAPYILSRKGTSSIPAGVEVTVIDRHQEWTTTTVREQEITRTREVPRYVMMWRKIDAQHILEESRWEGGAQPFIPVIGREFENPDTGERDFRGVIRDFKGAGMAYNALVTSVVETASLGSKAPVVGYTGQFGKPGTPQHQAWENAHLVPRPFLEVEPVNIDGKPQASLPQRNSFEPPIQATVLAVQQIDEDVKTTAGFRDASLAERGPQESGVAIDLRQKQDELGSSDYLDNLRFAIASAAKQLIALFRVHYDQPQVVRITGRADQQRKVMVFSGVEKDPRNEQYLVRAEADTMLPDGKTVIRAGETIPFALPEGVEDIYDLSAAEFDVEVLTGQDPGTRRQEELQFMGQLTQAVPPEVMVNFLDLMFGLIDSSKGQQMAERAKKLLPKTMRDDEDGAPPAVPPEFQQQFEQLAQQHKAAIETLRQAEEDLKTKRIETEAKERIERLKIQADRQQAVFTLYADVLKLLMHEENENDRAVLQAQIDHLGKMLELKTTATEHVETRQNEEHVAQREAAAPAAETV